MGVGYRKQKQERERNHMIVQKGSLAGVGLSSELPILKECS